MMCLGLQLKNLLSPSYKTSPQAPDSVGMSTAVQLAAVRSTGGRNSYRVLVLQGANISMTLTADLMNTLPDDPVPDRLMVEVHNIF